MLSLFIVLLSFGSSFAFVAKVPAQTKVVFLNDEPCMVISTLIDLNPVEF